MQLQHTHKHNITHKHTVTYIFNFLCTFIECTGEFHQVFSVGGDSFYVGVQRGDGGKTYFYHNNNQDVGLIRPGRGNRFIYMQ